MPPSAKRRAWCAAAGAGLAAAIVDGGAALTSTVASGSAALTASLLGGCAALGMAQPVQVTLVNIESLPGEGLELRLALKLRVQNPNETALDFDGLSLNLELRGISFASGVSDQHGNVPRFGETVMTIPVSVSALAAVREVYGLATTDHPRFDYRLRGRLAGVGFGGLQFESSGEISLPEGLGGG